MLTYLDPTSYGISESQQELDARFLDAINRKDLDAALACFWSSPDLIVVLCGHLLRGPDTLRGILADLFASHERIHAVIDEVTYVLAGEGVIGVGTATIDLQERSGIAHRVVERWSNVRRFLDGTWVYVLDHATIVGS